MLDDAVPTLRAARRPGQRAAVEVTGFGDGSGPLPLGPHRHGDLALMYYADGRGVDRLGRSAFTVAPGDVLLVAPGIVHDASGLTGVRGWAVEFGVDAAERPADPDSPTGLWWANPLLSPFVAAGTGPASARFHVPVADQPRWEARFAHMEDEQQHARPGWRVVLEALLHVTLVELSRLAAPRVVGLRDQGQTLLAQVFEVIDDRYGGPLSTRDVAAAVGMTPGHLTTVVRERTGRPVLDWVVEKRMAAARDLLLDTDLTVEEVGRRVGLPDPPYFSRRFRAYHGVSPGQWRAAASAAHGEALSTARQER